MDWERYIWPTLVGGLLTLVQIAPIKISPWSWLAGLLQKVLRWLILGDIPEKLNKLDKKIDDIEGRFQQEKASRIRWSVLDFGNSCLQGRRHTKEEWEHCLSEIEAYEDYCEKHDVKNGVMKEMCKYLRRKNQKIMDEHDYL